MRNLFKLFFSLAIFTSLLASFISAQIIIGKPKPKPPLDNPYTVNLPRAEVGKQIQEALQTCKTEMDTAATKIENGRFITKPYIFTRGLNTKSDLEYVSNLPVEDSRNWIKGRYYLEILALPLDDKRSQIQIISHLQAQMADGITTKWVDLPSNGKLEDEVIRGLASKLLGIDLSAKGNGRHRLMACEY
jgi:hypothetical protein